jgi:hypothetical protein
VQAGVRTVASYQVVTQTDTFALGSLPSGVLFRPAFPSCKRYLAVSPPRSQSAGIGGSVLFKRTKRIKPPPHRGEVCALSALCALSPPRIGGKCAPFIGVFVRPRFPAPFNALNGKPKRSSCNGSGSAGWTIWPYILTLFRRKHTFDPEFLRRNILRQANRRNH